MKVLYALLLVLALAGPVRAQAVVYNPDGIQFEHDAADVTLTTSYLVEYWSLDGLTGPLYTAEVAKAKATPHTLDGIVAYYTIAFSEMPTMPAATSYRIIMRAKGADGTSEPSVISPNAARWSMCAASSSTGVSPMTVSLTESQIAGGQRTAITLTVTNTLAGVHWVQIDLMEDGLPAYYWVSAPDLRGLKPYVIGPVRVGNYTAVLEAVDEQGCKVQTTTLLAVR